MKQFLRYIPTVFIAIIGVACTGPKQPVLGIHQLQDQQFVLNTNSDTVITTKDSMLLLFEKESFATSASTVTVTIKEALHLSDMVKAGLTTMSNGQPLQSGGMFYIGAAAGGKAVALKKRVEVKVPTYKYRSDMQLFKGQLKEDKLNWVEPQSLLNKKELETASRGEQLFKSNCTNCHKIATDFTGPALAHITERRCYDWVKAFTRNSQAMHDPVAQCVKKKWNNVVMVNYPMLNDTDMDALYGYIEAESKKLPRKDSPKEDDCSTIRIIDTIGVDEVVIPETTTSANFGKRPQPDNTPAPPDTTVLPVQLPDVPAVPMYPANNEYYEFTIEQTGWYNIDVLLNENNFTKEGYFRVQVQGGFTTRFSIYLIIPGRKILLPGNTSDNQFFWFKDNNYKLPLPAGETGLVFAMGEDGTRALWARQAFTFSSSQTIVLQPTQVPDVAAELAKLPVDSLEYSVTFKRKEKRYDIVETLYHSTCGEDADERIRMDSTRPVPANERPDPGTSSLK